MRFLPDHGVLAVSFVLRPGLRALAPLVSAGSRTSRPVLLRARENESIAALRLRAKTALASRCLRRAPMAMRDEARVPPESRIRADGLYRFQCKWCDLLVALVG